MGWSHFNRRYIKIQEGYLGNEESQPHTRPPAQGSSDRNINLHKFWLQKPTGTESVEGTSCPKQFLFKNPHTDLLILTPSELQHWGSSLKGPSGVQEELKCLAARQELGNSFLSDRKVGRDHCPFSKPSPTEPHRPQAGALSETPSPG